MYAWTITKDFIDEGRSVGRVGPRDATLDADAIRKHPDRIRFRLKDDDGEVYGEGFLVDLDGTASGFEPLDDWGLGAWGCTEIQHFRKGKGGGWESL